MLFAQDSINSLFILNFLYLQFMAMLCTIIIIVLLVLKTAFTLVCYLNNPVITFFYAMCNIINLYVFYKICAFFF